MRIGQNLNLLIAKHDASKTAKFRVLVGIGKTLYLVIAKFKTSLIKKRIAIKQPIAECWLKLAKIWTWRLPSPKQIKNIKTNSIQTANFRV